MSKTRFRLIAVLMALGLVAAACGDDSDDTAPGDDGDGTTTTAPDGNGNGDGNGDGMEPQSGGSITISMYSEPAALDPVASSGSGTAGGTELLALYDSIMRWDPEAQDFETRTAESLENNEDHTEWTLTLQDGITFRDGTPYDAEAVRLSFERHMGPENTQNTSRAHLEPVESVEVVDDLTVTFTLSRSWPGFPYVLADEPGMLVSPTALEALGDPDDPGYEEAKEEFNLHPEGAGAGPYEIDSFTPGEAIIMTGSDDYWGGEVYLDQIRFIAGGGGPSVWEGVETGNVDVGFLRTPVAADSAEQAGYPAYENITYAGGVLLLNNGVEVTCQDEQPAPVCEGQEDGASVPTETATSSKLVRQAVAAALDPDIINQRVNDGTGIPTNALLAEGFPYYPDVPGPEVDPERAEELLQQAMDEEGYDGNIRILCTNTPARQALAQTAEAQLEAVGFNVDRKDDIDIRTMIGEIIGKKDFDIGCWGYAIHGDEGAALALLQNLYSESPSNRVGFENAEFDEAIFDAISAATDEEKVAAYETMAEIYREEIPSLVFEAVPERIVWRPEVHGIYPNQASIFYLDKAWVEQ